MSRRTLIGVLSLLTIVGGIAGAFAYRHHQRYKHLAVHEKGMVYRSAWLEPDVLSELIEKYQFRSVVNLCRREKWAKPAGKASAKPCETPGQN